MFALDGKRANLTLNDVQRRNRITQLLVDWELITTVKSEQIEDLLSGLLLPEAPVVVTEPIVTNDALHSVEPRLHAIALLEEGSVR